MKKYYFEIKVCGCLLVANKKKIRALLEEKLCIESIAVLVDRVGAGFFKIWFV